MGRSRKLPPGVRIQDIMREVAHKCKAEVAGLPKGERVRAYRACVGREVKAKLSQYEYKQF